MTAFLEVVRAGDQWQVQSRYIDELLGVHRIFEADERELANEYASDLKGITEPLLKLAHGVTVTLRLAEVSDNGAP